jgi:CDP-glucose 4,6-dehydratase
MIAQRLLAGDRAVASGWNFGPADDDTRPVDWIADRLCAAWGGPDWETGALQQPHEAKLLKLDCAKARSELGWRPAFDLETALDKIVEWHRHVHEGRDARAISLEQLDHYASKWGKTLAGSIS